MNKLTGIASLVAVLLLCSLTAVMAQETAPAGDTAAAAAEAKTKAQELVDQAQEIVGKERFSIFFGGAFGAGLAFFV